MGTKGHRVPYKSVTEIRKVANSIRKYYALDFGYLNILKLLEHCMSDSRFYYDIVDDSELRGKAALSRIFAKANEV